MDKALPSLMNLMSFILDLSLLLKSGSCESEWKDFLKAVGALRIQPRNNKLISQFHQVHFMLGSDVKMPRNLLQTSIGISNIQQKIKFLQQQTRYKSENSTM